MTNSLKPLDFGKGLTPLDEALAELEAYQPSEPNQPSPEPEPSPAPIEASTDIQGSYILMPQTNRYAQGVHALQQACVDESNKNHPTKNGIYRPLIFKEDLQARLEDYETLRDERGNERSFDDRIRFFKRWLDSCCGVAYKGGTTKFKLVPICNELVTIDQGFNRAALDVNYGSIQGTELDSGKAKCGKLLTKSEIENHPAWIAAVEGDVELLKSYRDVVFDILRERNPQKKMPSKAMRFWVLNSPSNDQLRALFVNNLGYDSNAYGSNYLKYYGSFLRVAP